MKVSPLLALALIVAPLEAGAQQAAVPVSGRVLDGVLNGKVGLYGAAVSAAPLAPPGGAPAPAVEAQSDEQGNFTLPLPPGDYEIKISFEPYRTQVLPKVAVRPGRPLRLPPFTLITDDAAAKLVTVHVIREPDRNSTEAVNLQRKNAAKVTDVISAEEIKKSADSSASQAAARVVGATIVGDRFVYVRGLGDRYSNALFNGAPLPSPEPDQQAVPFDIFPASLLANLTIAKSASADIPGDFAGGSVQINTLEFPSKLTIGASANLGVNLSTSFQPFLTYPGGKLDGLGFNDGSRALPPGPLNLSGLPRSESAAYARTLNNIWNPRRIGTAAPDYGFAFSLGNKADLRGQRLGYMLSLNYSTSYVTREQQNRIFNIVGRDLPLGQIQALSGTISTQEVQLGALGNLVYMPKAGHQIGLSGIFTQSADDEARVLTGTDNENNNAELWSTRLRFVSRTFAFLQLSGTHSLRPWRRLGDLTIDWRGTYAYTGRDEPDNRETLYKRASASMPFEFDPKSTSGLRFYSQNQEHQVAGAVDATQSFRQWAGLESRFKIGALVRYRQREFSARRLRSVIRGPINGRDLTALQPEELFAPDNYLGKVDSGVELQEDTQPSDAYNGDLGVYSAYAMLDLALSARTRLVLGARFEAGRQRLRALTLENQPVNVVLDTNDILPSLNLVHRLREDMNLRASGSMTLARPEFRELAPFQFSNFYRELVQGEPGLQRTLIANADLRWEWFLGARDLLAVSLFYKYFDRPIETIVQVGSTQILSYRNANLAHNAGVELEAHKGLGFLSRRMEGLALGGNFSYIYSLVDLSGAEGGQTSERRPLQGQSPFVVNAFASFEKPSWGTQVRVLYNVFGERIMAVGVQNLPDQYQQPRHMLDVNISQQIGKTGLALRLTGRNLIDSPVDWTVTDPVTRERRSTLLYRTGRLISLSLSYAY